MKTKNIKKMISITWNLLNSIVKWVLPRANYVFPIIWVVFVVFFYKAIDTSISYSAEGQLPPVCQKSDSKIDQNDPFFLFFGVLDCYSKVQEQVTFRDRVILITYIATMLFVLLFFKQKKITGNKYSIIFLLLYFFIAFLTTGSLIYAYKTNFKSLMSVEGNTMSPVINNSDVIYIEKEASYERGDIVIFDGISENEKGALEIQFAKQILAERAIELGITEGENNTPKLPSKFPEENYIQKEKLKCFSQINIGRIVGFPTEKIVIRYGGIFINDTELSEPYVTNGFPENYTLDYVIPVGSYFILPDSRPGVCESTEVGGIPKVQILGKVTEIYSPGSGSLFEQRASGWLLITLLFLSPILISRRIIAPKTVRVFTAQYNMLSFLVFALIVVSAFAQKYFPSISLININWFFPANYFYLIVSWVKYVTQTSTYSALANIVIVFASVVISTIEIKEYIDKLSKSSRSKEISG